jgi:acyl carrier protein
MPLELGSQEIQEVIRTLLAEILEMPAEDIRADADLADDLEADSLHQLELMAAIEERFDIQLDVNDWSDARTIAELAERAWGRLVVPKR